MAAGEGRGFYIAEAVFFVEYFLGNITASSVDGKDVVAGRGQLTVYRKAGRAFVAANQQLVAAEAEKGVALAGRLKRKGV